MRTCVEIRISDDAGNPGIIRIPCDLAMSVMCTLYTNDGQFLNVKRIESMAIKID